MRARMTFALIGLLLTALAGLVAGHTGPDARAVRRLPLRRANAALVAALAFATSLGFVAYVAVTAAAAHAQRPFPAWFTQLPILVIDDRAPLHAHAPFGAAIESAVLFETLALGGLFFALRDRVVDRRTVAALVAAFVVMAAAALATPVATSFDTYAYAGAAKLGEMAYRPPAVAFPGDWSLINRIYGVPIVPSPYGPMWLGISRLIVSSAPTLGIALFAFRALGLAALIACAAALNALRFSAAAIALVALNPGLFSWFVLDAHNDLPAVALVLAAAALAERSLAGAALLGMLAIAIKAPFLTIAPLAFAARSALATRLWCGAATATGGIVISALFGGNAYLEALRKTAALYRAALADPVANGLHIALVAVALSATAAVLIARRYLPTLAWAYASLGTSLFGWYFAWGLPYAAAERRWLPPFLISLPFLAFLFSTAYAPTLITGDTFLFAVVAAPAFAFAVLLRERFARPAR
jgi:hypothetical protein